MEKEIVMYSRSSSCPFVRTAKQVLDKHGLVYRELLIDHHAPLRQRVLEWTGFESVPTLVAAPMGEDLPFEPPAPLARGSSPRGINRGSIITEPSPGELAKWLKLNGFLE